MYARKVTQRDMEKALARVNEKYFNNIGWYDGLHRENRSGTAFRFRLRANSYDLPGWRRSHSGRRMPSACWHVHGDFFDALLEIQPKARITSAGRVIDQAGGNWQDWNIGSMMQPLSFSKACECRPPTVKTVEAATVCRNW